MSKKNYTHLTLIVDRSGSMSNLATEVSGSINKLIEDQAAVEEGEITISIIQFDTEYEVVDWFTPAQNIDPYTLVPRGMTAMNDSVHRAILETKAKIKEMPKDERPENIIVTIVTDGYENASREVNNEQLKALVENRRAKDWEFVFMASNIDAQATASQFSINNHRTMAHTAQAYGASYETLNQAIATTRVAGKSFDTAWAEENEKE